MLATSTLWGGWDDRRLLLEKARGRALPTEAGPGVLGLQLIRADLGWSKYSSSSSEVAVGDLQPGNSQIFLLL